MRNDELELLGQAYAFIGNSLLSTMDATGAAGLEPAFWQQFPCFGDDAVEAAVSACEAYACEASERAAAGEDVSQSVSVEFTRLFVGPPVPEAAPWETIYSSASPTVGFGEPTFRMQRALRQAGLEVSNDNNQYADHMGLELLLLSVICQRQAAGEASDELSAAGAAAFAEDYPLPWVDAFSAAVHAAAPGGYYDLIVQLVAALLRAHAAAE